MAPNEPQEPVLPQGGVDPYIFMQPTPRAPATEPLFRPRQKEGISALTVGLILASVLVGLFALGQWAWLKWMRPAAPAETVAVAAAPAPAPAPAAVSVPAAPAPDAAAPVAAEAPPAVVHRCENAVGEISYTDGPCPKGTREQVVNTAEALRVDGEGGATLYRCKGAGLFWSDVHCQHRGAYVVNSFTVPARLPLAEQIVFAQNREALLKPARTRAPRAAEAGPPAPPDAAAVKAAECKGLGEKVAALDDYARQPLTGQDQDRVSRQRRELRDQQFRRGCGR